MKTNQIMKREFLGSQIRQEHKTGYFNISDLLAVGNKMRKSLGLPQARWDVYKKSEKTKEFIASLIRSEDKADIIKVGRGRYSETWVHPLVFFDFAMWLSPDFKVKVYKWLYDNLTVFRDESGESYKKMGSLIQSKYGAGKVGLYISDTAKRIKEVLGVSNWNEASEDQLKKRDEIHKSITLLLKAEIDIRKATDLALTEYNK